MKAAAATTMTVDPGAYLHRIGYAGDLVPTRETLAALVAHHAAAIAFENIDVLARRVPKLDEAALHAKLVAQPRGGYCFEQNGLFLAVLRAIGFTARAMEARVRAGVPDEVVTGRTHMALRVRLEGEDWLVDVGFGGLAPLAPLRLASREAQATSGGEYRLVEAGPGELLLQVHAESGWSPCYCLGPVEPQRVDHEIGNWFVATHPTSMLANNLLVGRALPGGGRLVLFNRKLTTRGPDPRQPAVERVLHTRAEVAGVLGDGFGLALGAPEIDAVMATLERQDAARA